MSARRPRPSSLRSQPPGSARGPFASPWLGKSSIAANIVRRNMISKFEPPDSNRSSQSKVDGSFSKPSFSNPRKSSVLSSSPKFAQLPPSFTQVTEKNPSDTLATWRSDTEDRRKRRSARNGRLMYPNQNHDSNAASSSSQRTQKISKDHQRKKSPSAYVNQSKNVLSTFNVGLENLHGGVGACVANEEKSGVANMWAQDASLNKKVGLIHSQHEKKQAEQTRISNTREAMRVFRKRMNDKSKNTLSAFKKIKHASGSSDLLIDIDEFKTCLNMSGLNLSEKVAQNVFSRFDRDGSGEIDFNEFSKKLQQDETPRESYRATDSKDLEKKRKMKLNAADFGAVDLDGDGVIDADEQRLAKYIKHIEGEDLDGDGEISAAERLAAQQKAGRILIMKEFQGKHKGRMHLFGGPQCKDKSDDEMIQLLAASSNFSQILKRVTTQSHMMDLKSSIRFIEKWGIQHPDQVNGWKKEYVFKRNRKLQTQRDDIFSHTRQNSRVLSLKSSKLREFLKEHTGHSRFTKQFATTKRCGRL